MRICRLLKSNASHRLIVSALIAILTLSIMGLLFQTSTVSAANPPQPTYGTAKMDGTASEWDLTNDFFANMYRAGDSTKPLESKAYLRYDCSFQTMYVLVLTEPGVPAVADPAMAWGAIGSVSNKVYTGNSGNGSTLPAFVWVGQGYDGNASHAQGYEAAFSLAPGNYTIIIHIEVYDAGGNQTSATIGFPRSGIPLVIKCTPNPAIQVEKMISTDNTTWIDANTPPGPTVTAGSNIYYRFNVTNTGNVTLSNIALTDSLYSLSASPPSTLAPNASYIYYFGPIVSQFGVHTNTANATGTFNNTKYSDTDDANYNGIIPPVPGISVIKLISADNETWFDANTPPGLNVSTGTDVYYKYIITNAGTVTLYNLSLTDNAYSLSFALPASLPFNSSLTYYYGPVTALAGQHTNTATATGQYENANYTSTDDANYFGSSPSISVIKYISSDNSTWIDANTPPGLNVNAGSNVYYKFVVNNTGNVLLSPVYLLDDVYNLNVSHFSLAPGETLTYYYGPTDALIGQHTNTVTAAGQDPLGSFHNATDTANYYGATPAIAVIKQISTDNSTWIDADTPPGPQVPVGSNVYYRFIITNTGNIALSNLTLTDNTYTLVDLTLPTTLDPGASFAYYLGPITTQAGQHTNTATATGQYENLNYTSLDDANYFGVSPSISVVKYVSFDNAIWVDANTPPGLIVATGSNVYYKFVVNNTGSVELFNITLTDDVYSLSPSPPMFLSPNETFTYYFGPVTALSGQHANTANATGEYNAVTYNASDSANYFGASASISTVKYISSDNSTWIDANTPPGLIVSSGSNIYYKFVINNTGTAILFNISLTDSVYSLSAVLPASLAPNETFTYFYGPVSALDGQHTNTASATGQLNNVNYTSTDDANYFGESPAISVVKLISLDNSTWIDANTPPGPTVTAGSNVYYKFVITNIGNIELSNITLSDNTYTLENLTLPETLAPNASFTYYFGPTSAQLGQHTNTATATGQYNNTTYSDTYDGNYNGIQPGNPAIKIVKYVSVDCKKWCDANSPPGPTVLAGKNIYYKFVVTNIGDVTISNITLSDDPFIDFSGFSLPSTLQPGESFTLIIRGLKAGLLQNTDNATVTGTYNNQTVSNSDVANYYGILKTYTSSEYAKNKMLKYYFKAAFCNGMEIGYYTDPSGYGDKWTNVNNLKLFLKCTGTSGSIRYDKLNPTNTMNGGGKLAVQTATLTLNIAFGNLSIKDMPSGLGELYYVKAGDSLSNMTVSEILAICNGILSGQPLPEGYTYNSLSSLIMQLNKAFDGGKPTTWAMMYLKASI